MIGAISFAVMAGVAWWMGWEDGTKYAAWCVVGCLAIFGTAWDEK